MNVYLISVILGIVEGLTEFLPVSSTAHLRITEALLQLPMSEATCTLSGSGDCLHAVAYWKMYTIVIQAGAILALLLLYLARILEFLRTFPRGDRGDRNFITHPLSLTILAFGCTSVLALAFKKWSDRNLESLTVIAIALVVGGILMWIIDARSTRYEPNTIHVEEIGLGQALWVGICQSFSAIFPGTSRSMSTIAAGQMAGMDRPTALEFSFLLSIPTMLAATGYDLWKEVLHPARPVLAAGTATAQVTMTGQLWVVLAIGFVVSFIVAYGVVEWFLAWVRKHGFTVFAIYRILLGITLLILMWRGVNVLGG